MTDVELAQATALAKCKFSPGTTAKRFVATMAHKATTAPLEPLSKEAAKFLDRLGHSYRKQLGRCMSASCIECNATVDLGEVAIAADAALLGDRRFDDRIPAWRKLALRHYNAKFSQRYSHPYAYATKVAPENRRAVTLGDIFCRFCGEQLFAQVKQPHKLVANSDFAQQHLTACALQVLAGIRKPAPPGHRALPMEDMWR